MHILPCLALGFAALLAATAAPAQPLPPAPPFSGPSLDGRNFDLQARRGRVVMVVLWRSDCAVCLSKMTELRANAQGWKAQPFDLLLVNLDASAADAQVYDRARRQIDAGEGERGILGFWHGDTRLPAAWRSGEKLPRTYLIDREGRIAYSHEGRIPAEVWNQVADLLP
jgi:peroxiredoxin